MNAKIAIALFSALFLFCCSQPEEAALCGGKYFYNKQTEFCPFGYYEFPPKIYKKCNGEEFDPEIQVCSEDGSKLLYHCNGIVYEHHSQFCSDNGVVDKEIFTDSRDNKEYKTVVIGKQTWMAENLNYETPDSQCYKDDPENCAVYGRLYDWETALAACPEGWDLPSETDFDILFDEVGGYNEGSKLKTINGWETPNYGYGYASDAFGFSALPGGYISKEGISMYIKKYGFWWSSREDKNTSAVYFQAEYDSSHMKFGYSNKLNKNSVRCIKHSFH
ncbi:MAG: fibrobacter succinogenes major paralogous domain-containing protein [Fibromonadales bacterium]|nr:fibrobacter succinogenes major paralogous domain-containing protein [Fibromonadales bacterium]